MQIKTTCHHEATYEVTKGELFVIERLDTEAERQQMLQSKIPTSMESSVETSLWKDAKQKLAMIDNQEHKSS